MTSISGELLERIGPATQPCWTGDRESFAYVSAKDRWPIILTGIVDDVKRTMDSRTSDDAIEQGKRIIHDVGSLKYEIEHDKPLTPLTGDGVDVGGYNAELALLSNATWFNVPWLFAECYMYRRVFMALQACPDWKNYDPFARQKMDTLRQSENAVRELADRFMQLCKMQKTPSGQDPKWRYVTFVELIEVCLWGNATDLSLLTSASYDDLQKLQGSKAVEASRANIIVDQLDSAWAHLSGSRARRIDIVLDNAGFELYVDMVIAAYLLEFGLADTVVLHPKSMPWFVSDAMPQDIAGLFMTLTALFPGESTQGLADMWARYHAEGQLIIRPHYFWTTAHSFWRMKEVAPGLHEDLKTSDMVMFKGDLNYRKLTADAQWPRTTSWAEAIGSMIEINSLALRTCKADVCVGLQEGQAEELAAKDPKWDRDGKWAVIMFQKQ